jgi:CRP/FNR family transcriptional regulator
VSAIPLRGALTWIKRNDRFDGRVQTGMTRAEDLRRLATFEGLEGEHLRVLARLAVRRRLPAGTPVFAEGDPADGFYVVLEGRVRIFKMGPDGREQILHIWGAGEPFGEAAALEGFPYPAHAEAMDDAAVLFIPRSGLFEEVRCNPDFALALLTLLSRRLRRFAGLIESLSLKEVPGRLAAYLLVLSDRRRGADLLNLDITKAQLAAVLGTIPETLSRILGRMARERIAATEGPRGIRLLDRDALRRLADGEQRLS